MLIIALFDIVNEGLTKVFDWYNEFVFDGGRRDSASKAEFFGFGDALVSTESGANLAAEADFAEDDVFFAELTSCDGGGDGHTNGEIGGRVSEFHAADDVDKNVFVGEL